MFCPSCGKPSGDGNKFCSNCGAELPGAQQPPSSSAEPVTPDAVFSGLQYIIEQKIVALRDTFGVKDRDGKLLAYVKKQIVSFGPKFWYETQDGTRLGEIHGRVLTVRPTFEIYDVQGTLVAVVKKKILKLLGSEWWLEDASGGEIARIKGNVLQHDFSIQSPSGVQIAQIHKKWVSVRDSYGIDILTRDLNPYVIVSYVIAMDHAEFKVGRGVALGLGSISLGGMVDDFTPKKAWLQQNLAATPAPPASHRILFPFFFLTYSR